MTKEQLAIFTKATKIRDEIEDAIQTNTFTLNTRIQELEKKLEKVQKDCDHEYDEVGYCIYCGKREVK